MVIPVGEKDHMLSFYKFWEQEISGDIAWEEKSSFNVKELFTLIRQKPD